MKNRPHRYDINKPKSRNGQKYKKYKKRITMMMLMMMLITMMMLMRIKQHLRNISSSILKKVKQH